MVVRRRRTVLLLCLALVGLGLMLVLSACGPGRLRRTRIGTVTGDTTYTATFGSP